MNRFFLFIALLTLYFQGYSYDFKSEGITYSIIDNKSVEVSQIDSEDFVDYYTINVPSIVTYNDISYAVVRLGEGAFKNCNRLKSLVLPHSIKEIGPQAIAECKSLESVELKSGLLTISDRAFENSSVKSLSIPSSVTKIGEMAFCNLETLNVVFEGNSEVMIGNEAFIGSSVERVSLSNSLTSISEGCFKNCLNLKEVIMGIGTKSINKFSFSGCTSLVSLTITSPEIDLDDDAFVESNIQAIGFSFTERPMFSPEPFYRAGTISLISVPIASFDIFNNWAGKLFDNKERITLENYYRFGTSWIYPGTFTSWQYEDHMPKGLVSLPDTDTMLLTSRYSDITLVYPEITGCSFDILVNGKSAPIEWVSAQPDKKFNSPTDIFLLGVKIVLEDISEDTYVKVIDGPSSIGTLAYNHNLKYDSHTKTICAPNECIYIYDAAGRLILTGKDSVSTSHFENGIYFVRTSKQTTKINIRI